MLANRGDCCCYSTTKIRIWCRAGRPWTLSRRLCRWRLWWCSVVDNQLQGCSPIGTKNLPGSSFPVSRSRGPPNTWPENIENYQYLDRVESLETAKDIKCLRAQLSSCVILLRDRLTDSSLAWRWVKWHGNVWLRSKLTSTRYAKPRSFSWRSNISRATC